MERQEKQWKAVAALCAVILTGLGSRPIEAAVSVVDVAHIVQTIAHLYARYEEIEQKYEQIDNQLEQLEYEKQNLERISGQWRDVRTLMVELSDVIQPEGAVVYSRDDLPELWQETYPGLVRLDLLDYPLGPQQHFEESSKRTLATQWGVMRNVRHQSTRFHTSHELLEEIKATSDAAEGNVAVTQASNMLLGFLAEEQTKTLQMITAATNSFVVYAAYRLTREMQSLTELFGWLQDARRPVLPLDMSRKG